MPSYLSAFISIFFSQQGPREPPGTSGLAGLWFSDTHGHVLPAHHASGRSDEAISSFGLMELAGGHTVFGGHGGRQTCPEAFGSVWLFFKPWMLHPSKQRVCKHDAQVFQGRGNQGAQSCLAPGVPLAVQNRAHSAHVASPVLYSALSSSQLLVSPSSLCTPPSFSSTHIAGIRHLRIFQAFLLHIDDYGPSPPLASPPGTDWSSSARVLSWH